MNSLVTKRIVIKIGGAALYQPNGIENELRSLLSENQNAQVWLLVGGGDLIESMRTLHRIYPFLNEQEMHWRCVELLDHTWAIAKEVVSSAQRVTRAIATHEELKMAIQEGSPPGVLLVRVQSFYNCWNTDWIPGKWLPKLEWNTTTDALAWLLGKIINADRVILVKKCECDPSWTIAEAAKLGVIDSELERLVHTNPGKHPIVELQQVE